MQVQTGQFASPPRTPVPPSQEPPRRSGEDRGKASAPARRSPSVTRPLSKIKLKESATRKKPQTMPVLTANPTLPAQVATAASAAGLQVLSSTAATSFSGAPTTRFEARPPQHSHQHLRAPAFRLLRLRRPRLRRPAQKLPRRLRPASPQPPAQHPAHPHRHPARLLRLRVALPRVHRRRRHLARPRPGYSRGCHPSPTAPPPPSTQKSPPP